MLYSHLNSQHENYFLEPKVNSADSLEKTFHQLIPISLHMGVKVKSYDGNRLVIKAPLSNNINHQQSAFGGSLFSLTALAGWGILQLKLGELKLSANTVVAGGEVGYSAPVFEDLLCSCDLPEEYPAFVDKLKNKGRASIQLTANIILESGSAMMFSGKFVVSLD